MAGACPSFQRIVSRCCRRIDSRTLRSERKGRGREERPRDLLCGVISGRSPSCSFIVSLESKLPTPLTNLPLSLTCSNFKGPSQHQSMMRLVMVQGRSQTARLIFRGMRMSIGTCVIPQRRQTEGSNNGASTSSSLFLLSWKDPHYVPCLHDDLMFHLPRSPFVYCARTIGREEDELPGLCHQSRGVGGHPSRIQQQPPAAR